MLRWETYDTAAALPEGLWNATAGKGEVCLDVRLFRVSERVFPQNRFHYFVGRKNGAIAAVTMGMEAGAELITGTPETSGFPGWFDETRTDRAEFIREWTALTRSYGKTIVLRDFYPHETEWERILPENGFSRERGMDISLLEIDGAAQTLGDHIAGLRSKYRYQIGQYRSAIDSERYEFAAVTDYMPLIGELYPLYLEVCARAEEYAAEPYPAEYFGAVKAFFGDDAVMITCRDKEKNEYLGFMLLLYGQESCVHQYIGFRRIDDLFLWHNLTLESVGDAIRRGIRKINMGVTHTTAKHKFGAVSVPTYYYSKP